MKLNQCSFVWGGALILCGALLGMAVDFHGALAASDADTVIAECQRRTGMERESCIGFIKRYMNVDRCQSYTKLSASECEQKLIQLKQSPEFRDTVSPKRDMVPSEMIPKQPVLPSRPPEQTASPAEWIRVLRQEKAERFRFLRDQTETLIRYFEGTKRDMQQARAALVIFEQKEQVALKAYDEYARFVDGVANGAEIPTGPRETVQTLLLDATEYYREAVLSQLRIEE